MTSHKCRWTRYRLTGTDGVVRRLLKVAGPVEGVRHFRLLSADGVCLDEEPGPPDARGTWHFGFWVPESHVDDPEFVLEVCGGSVSKRITLKPGVAPEGDALPLRLDRTGAWLRDHLERRENVPTAAELAGFVPDMGEYLRRHRVIYHRPAEHWGEGLFLGNGNVGALVSGTRGKRQRYDLDRCDLWATTPQGRPIGRVYGGRLELVFDTVEAEGAYLQELLLHEAEVVTQDGGLSTTARVHANRDVLEVAVRWDGPKPLALEVELSREATPLLEEHTIFGAMCNGSWETSSSPAEMQQAKEYVGQCPRTSPRAGIEGEVASVEHPLPNMAYAMAVRVAGAEVAWDDRSTGGTARVCATVSLALGSCVTVLVAVASDRAGSDPVEEAARLLREDLEGHREWWRGYWERSFVEYPDKLVENLWYIGAYHQAAFSRSLQAPGFFALWHPLDYRTWDDGYVADAQTALMWWAAFGTGHLELLLPAHNTFGAMMAEFLEHNPGDGALAPHHFFPEWAGGHTAFGKPNPYKGSIGWFALAFWWDFLHTGDVEFLRAVGYPGIAACADFHANDLVMEDDGRFHCIESGAPEQNDTARDNIYDHACITAALRAAVRAAKVLEVDDERAAGWQDVLDRLFDVPCDDATLWETAENHHPYRCHPVVLFGVHPMGTVEPGDPEWAKADAAYDVLTDLFGFHYQDRHASIPGHEGGVEPNGHAAAFMLHAAARLRGWREVLRLVYGVVVRTQLKRNGLRSICDPRHSRRLCDMAISEATSGQTSGLSEVFVQSYSDHVRCFALDGCEKGTFRFAGLRAFGGFVLAGEWVDGAATELSVYSVRGGRFRIMNPWPGETPRIDPPVDGVVSRLRDGEEAIEFDSAAGQTYLLSAMGATVSEPRQPSTEERNGPRSMRCGDWDAFEPPIAYYPEDLPFGQEAAGDVVFLGMPDRCAETDAAHATMGPEADVSQALGLSGSVDWRARQTAARWLGRWATRETTARLVALAEEDETPVVQYTAGVALVRQRSAEALAEALRIARDTDTPHLRREILKAVSRLARDEEGAGVLAACLGDLALLERVWPAGCMGVPDGTGGC